MAKKKESKQKKMNVRVDFTPMVDMMMLLITFFMLCTSLAKPQAMQLTMPAKQDAPKDQKEKSKTELTVDVYLLADNKIYTYIVDKAEKYGDPEYLEEVTWGTGKGSIRDKLVNYNPYKDAVAPIQAIMNAKKQLDAWVVAQPKTNKDVNDSIYEHALSWIRKGKLDVVSNNSLNKAKYDEYDRQSKDPNFVEDNDKLATTINVNIKPLDDSTYDNLVTILDEMAVCCIGTYRISNVNVDDLTLLSKKEGTGVQAPAAAAPAAP